MKFLHGLCFLALLVVFGMLTFCGCVSTKRYRRDVLAHYKKGLKVGRVIGRDEILFKLKSPDCFQQTADELMKDTPMSPLIEQAVKETDKQFEQRERQLGIVK